MIPTLRQSGGRRRRARGGGSLIVSDDFNRSAGVLDSPWFHLSGNTARITSAGRLRSTDGDSAALYNLPATYPTEYRVKCDFYRATALSTSVAGVTGRSSTATSQYLARYYALEGRWELYIFNVVTTLLDAWSDPFPAGDTRQVELVISNASKEVWVDGVLRITSGNDEINNNNPAGIRHNSGADTDGAGILLDNFQVWTL